MVIMPLFLHVVLDIYQRRRINPKTTKCIQVMMFILIETVLLK